MYRQTSNIRRVKSQNLNMSRLAVAFAQPIEARCHVENEDMVGAATTGAEWSTRLLPTKVRLILKVWRYMFRYIYVHIDIIGFNKLIKMISVDEM